MVTQDEFETKAIEPLRNDLTQPLEDIFMKDEVTNEGITKDNIDEVLMVGGSVRIPMVQDIVRQFFPSTTTMNISSYPDECVAHGAAYYAHMIKNTPEEDQLKLVTKIDYEEERKDNELLNTIKMMFVGKANIETNLLEGFFGEMQQDILYKEYKK